MNFSVVLFLGCHMNFSVVLFLGCHMNFHVMFFCYQAPNSLGGHSGQIRLHLSHQGNRGLSLSMT